MMIEILRRSGVRVIPNLSINVIDDDTGEIRTLEVHNTVGTDGLNLLRAWFQNESTPGVTHIKWMEGSTEVLRTAVTQRVNDTAKATVKFYLSSLQATGHTIDGAILCNAATGGTEYASASFEGVNKTDSNQITASWENTFADDGA